MDPNTIILRLRKALNKVFCQLQKNVQNGVWLWTGLLSVALFRAFALKGYDDPYITYRYAAQLAHGLGFVYNAGERILSTTTPLYALLLALAALLNLDLPTVSNALGSLGCGLGGLAFWQIGQKYQNQSAGIAGLILYPTFPLLLNTLGAEMPLYNALILWGFATFTQTNYRQAAFLFALATLTRADGILAAAIFFSLLLERKRTFPWQPFLIYTLPLAVWGIFAWAYFGSPLPVTLAAKQHQGMMAHAPLFFPGIFEQAQFFLAFPLYHFHFGLAILGFAGLLTFYQRWLPLFAWNLLYISGYTALGVTSYFWYYAPLVIGFLLLVTIGLAMMRQLLSRFGKQHWSPVLTFFLLLLLLLPQLFSLEYLRQTNDSRLVVYQQVGKWLNSNTPKEASIGTLEVGIIGYYAERRMIDFAGLLQPETALRLTATTTYQDAARWAIAKYHPDYLVLQTGVFPQIEAELGQKCQNVKTFTEKAFSGQLTVSQCRWK